MCARGLTYGYGLADVLPDYGSLEASRVLYQREFTVDEAA